MLHSQNTQPELKANNLFIYVFIDIKYSTFTMTFGLTQFHQKSAKIQTMHEGIISLFNLSLQLSKCPGIHGFYKNASK